MDIQRTNLPNGGKFFFEKDGKSLAEMTYLLKGDDMVIDHTEVDVSLRGLGIGQKLVEAGIGFARENQKKIDPVCPFVRKLLERSPQYQDVWSFAGR